MLLTLRRLRKHYALERAEEKWLQWSHVQIFYPPLRPVSCGFKFDMRHVTVPIPLRIGRHLQTQNAASVRQDRYWNKGNVTLSAA